MKKIAAIYFHDITLPAHLRLFYQIDALLAAAGEALQDAVAPLLPPFRAALEKENAVYLWVRRSEFTAAIAAANVKLNSAVALINAGVDFGRRSPAPAIAASGLKAYDMLKNYGNIMLKSYDEKTVAVRETLEHFATDCAPDVANLGLATQVQQLQTALDMFESLLRQRSAERVAKPPCTALEARRKLEAAWRPVTYLINSNAGAGASADFATFINHLNPEIERINAEYHRVRKDLGRPGHTVIEPLPLQPFTGQRVTPLPEVYYTEDDKPAVKLFLGSDFSIIYRNNRKAGMAELTIRGKGKYRGKKRATFHIAPV
ncbi:MAG: DUF6261 family protein [Prevotellaceae bacterium]|jgi:hypothetical protein|nr:DUF6261 family protein [Prevotellaceae bacterium]